MLPDHRPLSIASFDSVGTVLPSYSQDDTGLYPSPSYTTLIPARRPSVPSSFVDIPSTEHRIALCKGRTEHCATLYLYSSSANGDGIPRFLAGHVVRGKVALKMQDMQAIRTVSVQVSGAILHTGLILILFLQIRAQLVENRGPDTGQSIAGRTLPGVDELTCERVLLWTKGATSMLAEELPFEMPFPETMKLKDGTTLALPETFDEPNSRVHIIYEFMIIVEKGSVLKSTVK